MMRAFYNKTRDALHPGHFNRSGATFRGMGVVQVVARSPRIPDEPLIGARVVRGRVELYTKGGTYVV